jgi:hypothetical protein
MDESVRNRRTALRRSALIIGGLIVPSSFAESDRRRTRDAGSEAQLVMTGALEVPREHSKIARRTRPDPNAFADRGPVHRRANMCSATPHQIVSSRQRGGCI